MTTQEETSASSRFSDRLVTARRSFFVGRAAELELFRQALLAEEAPFAVLYLFGPGDVGKTTLLREYARLAAEQGRPVYRLDGRDVDPSPQGFLLALSQAIGPETPPLSLKTLAELPPAVLLLDTYERLAALDGWLREVFFPAFRLEQAPAVIRLLVERFVQDTPTPRHRQALEVCAHARVMTEALLAAGLGQEYAGDLFRWLQSLSFIERSPQGLFPHDLVRDVLEADLRRRNPEVHREMHCRVRQYLQQRYNDSQGVEQQRAFLDILYLHKYLVMRSRYEFKEAGDAYIESATPDSHAAILQIVERHEGKRSAACAAYWLERQPHGFEVFRATDHAILGFVVHLMLHTVTPEDEQHDPALVGLWRYVRSTNPLRAGECLLVTRFWMGWETYQDVFIRTLSPPLRSAAGSARLTWPGHSLAWPIRITGQICLLISTSTASPKSNSSQVKSALGFLVGVWSRNRSGWTHWPSGELQEGFHSEPPTSPPSPELLVLSQPEFADAVRQALRDYHRLDALTRNPCCAPASCAMWRAPTPTLKP